MVLQPPPIRLPSKEATEVFELAPGSKMKVVPVPFCQNNVRLCAVSLCVCTHTLCSWFCQQYQHSISLSLSLSVHTHTHTHTLQFAVPTIWTLSLSVHIHTLQLALPTVSAVSFCTHTHTHTHCSWLCQQYQHSLCVCVSLSLCPHTHTHTHTHTFQSALPTVSAIKEPTTNEVRGKFKRNVVTQTGGQVLLR